MTEATKETLIEFIQRILRQKALSLHDIERNSDKAITSSYISKITKGKIKSISVETIAALAVGLDVDPFDVFAAAYGRPYRSEEAISSLLLIDVMQKVVANPQLVKVIQDWPKMSARGRVALLQYMEILVEPNSQPDSQPKSRKKRKKR
jgi:transcriptional regulator with XRE-family HTH domain